MDNKGGYGPLFLALFLFLCFSFFLSVDSQCDREPTIFVFGDSNSDTGGYEAGTGLITKPPNGMTFFHHPVGRFCDGRLVIDFLCESLKISYLTPYLESLRPNFSNGANFAVSSSSTMPRYANFNLDVQILQFLRFQDRSLKLRSAGSKILARDDAFQNALYILDTGENDLARDFFNLSYSQVVKNIPTYIEEIKYAILNISKHGGQNFWVHNSGPLGCLPMKLAITSKNTSDLDQYGCLQSLNDGAKAFNEKLHLMCDQLRVELKNATIIYVDMFTIRYDLIANATKYGFENPLMACCGYGGQPYNTHPRITCGKPGYNRCEDPSKYISWDGVHYTEAANIITAEKILSTIYCTPSVKFNFFCKKSSG